MSWRRPTTIRGQWLAFALAAWMPVFGLIAYEIIAASNRAAERGRQDTQRVALDGAHDLAAFVGETGRLLARMSERPLVRALDPRFCEPIIETASLFPEFINVSTFDAQGKVICARFASPPQSFIAAQQWFRQGLLAGEPQVTEGEFLPPAGPWVVLATQPVRDERGNVKALLVLSLNLATLQSRVLGDIGSENVVSVVDGNGRFLMRTSEAQQWVGRIVPDLKGFRERVKLGLTGERLRGVDGIDRAYSYTSVPGTSWTVIAGIPVDVVMGAYRRTLLWGTLIGFAALAAAIMLALWLSARLTRPIRALEHSASRAAHGDYSVRIAERGPRDISAVATQFNHMLETRERLEEERARIGGIQATLAAIVQSAEDAVIGKTLDGTIVSWNPGAERLFGYTADEMVGQSVRLLIPADRQSEEAMILDRVRAGERVTNYESRRLRKDGTEIDVSLTISPIRDLAGRITGASKIVRDIGERLAAQKRVLRLTDLYAALSRTNNAIVHMGEPDALFQEICSICAQHTHATVVFIAMVEDDALHPRVFADPEHRARIAPDFPVGGTAGPIGLAVRDNHPFICNDIEAVAPDVPWRTRLLERGARSVVTFPLRRGGQPVGVLCLMMSERDYFDENVVALLDEMAGDVSFALDNVDRAAERERLGAEARESERRFSDMLKHLKLIALMVDRRGDITFCNDCLLEATGWTRQELLGRNWFDTFAPEEGRQQRRQRFLSGIDSGPGIWHFEGEILTRDGRTRAIRWDTTVLRAPAGEIIGSASVGEDITDRKQYEARIEHLATHDGLTDLPNRNLAQDRLTQAIAHSRRTSRQLAVLYVDLDRFKVVNDGYGHAVGDAVIRAAGERLVSKVREGDTVARQGGDEFLVLLEDLRRSSDVYIVTQKILDAFEAPIVIEGREIYVTVTIGVSLFPQDGQAAEVLVAHADVAMYRAKELGRNAYQFFTSEMSEETHRRVAMETGLRTAVAQHQLELHYQPKVDLASGRLVGCEALVRWNHPGLGRVSPSRFIPVAEDSGLIVPIGDWVMRTACAQARAWQDEGLPPVRVSINVSARQFLQQDLVAWVMKVVGETGIAPPFIELELTESLIAQDTDKAIETVDRLKAAGIAISIDDFGTGYSSLSYLKRFPVDTLKIDQSFIRNMMDDADGATIALAIISLAKSLRLRVIAEGVETAAQCDFLRLHRCDEIQGYYFSKPLPAAEFAELLRSGRRLGEAHGPAGGAPA